jgi:hypothetical protein
VDDHGFRVRIGCADFLKALLLAPS